MRRRAANAPLARTLDAVLLLEPHQRRRELGRIVAVGIRRVDDVLLDDRRPAAPRAAARRPRPAAPASPRGRRASRLRLTIDVVDEVVADVGEERARGAATPVIDRASRRAGWPRCRRTPSGPARPPSASRTSVMSRFGRTLLNRLPGPMTIMSASRMRSSASRLARTSAGSMKTRSIGSSAVADRDLAVQVAPGGELRRQVERDARGRQDLAAHGQHPVRLAHRLLEVAGDRGHGGDEEVAEGVVVEARARREAVLHELGHERLGIGQRGDAVADVPGRHDAELLAQPAAAAAVVGHRHDGGDVARCSPSGRAAASRARSRRRCATMRGPRAR